MKKGKIQTYSTNTHTHRHVHTDTYTQMYTKQTNTHTDTHRLSNSIQFHFGFVAPKQSNCLKVLYRALVLSPLRASPMAKGARKNLLLIRKKP